MEVVVNVHAARTTTSEQQTRFGIVTVSKRKLTTSETETRSTTPPLTKPHVDSDEDGAQADPRTPYENPNRSQETTLKLVDVTGNSLMTTSIQLQSQNAPQHSRRRYKGLISFFF